MVHHVDIRARPQQVKHAHVPQLGRYEAVGGQLPVGGVTPVQQVLDVEHVDRLAIAHRVAASDTVRIGGFARHVVHFYRVIHQRPYVPVGRTALLVFFARRVEDKAQPLFGAFEVLLLVQTVADHERQVQEQLPEIQAVGTVKIHLVNGRWWIERGLFKELSIPGQQVFQGDIGAVDQLACKQCIHADGLAWSGAGIV